KPTPPHPLPFKHQSNWLRCRVFAAPAPNFGRAEPSRSNVAESVYGISLLIPSRPDASPTRP
ncbi:MAG: hypothetical protein MUF49_24590, partial [Oculatellaceae cyanobacterium Prado106]|nr:hypothetical protein [Oculatellaceae cyanobacterium Prado106]